MPIGIGYMIVPNPWSDLSSSRALPMSSGQTPGSRLEENPTRAYRDALIQVLQRLNQATDPLADDIAELFADFDSRYEPTMRLAIEMLSRRDQWLDPLLASFASDASLPEMLDSGYTVLLEQVVGDLLDALSHAEQRELADVAATAASHLGLNWSPTVLPDSIADWRQLSAMFATNDGHLRKVAVAQQRPATIG